MTGLRAGLVAAVLQFVAGAGGHPARVRATAGIRPGDLVDPDRLVDLSRVAAVLSAAADELHDPAFGLHLGANFELESLGLVTYAVLNADTVETGMRNLVRYLGTLLPGAQADFVVARGIATLRLDAAGLDRQAAGPFQEAGVLAVLRMLRHLLGDDAWAPQTVTLSHAAPRDTSEHRRRFGVTPSFGARHNELGFDAALLAREVLDADRSQLPLVEQRLEKVVRGEPDDEPWLAALRVQIASRLCDGHPNLVDLAPRVGVSARTLQRRLGDRGLAYRDLVQQARRRLALEYLERTDTGLTEIAFLLGYSELSAFAHAFSRWTGRSPGSHRRGHRSRARGARSVAALSS